MKAVMTFKPIATFKLVKTVTTAVTYCMLATSAIADTFSLQSTDIHQGQALTTAQVFNGFGCTGANQSPQLEWQNPPVGTRSFAVTVYDPDAPTGSGWWHWVAFNIPATIKSLPTNAGAPDKKLMPAGAVQSRTDFGTPGFGGACPPVGHGKHRYQFTVYALSVEKIDLDANATGALAGYMINSNKLGQASIEAIYER